MNIEERAKMANMVYEDEKQMIVEYAEEKNLPIRTWGENNDYVEPRPRAFLDGDYEVVDEDANMLTPGDRGAVSLEVVGAFHLGNQRVTVDFWPEGEEEPMEVELNHVERVT